MHLPGHGARSGAGLRARGHSHRHHLRIVSPLKGSGDPVQVALRIERAYPEFNDSLVSAVQFQRCRPRTASARQSLSAGWRSAGHRARPIAYDFSRAVDSRGTKRSVFWRLQRHRDRRDRGHGPFRPPPYGRSPDPWFRSVEPRRSLLPRLRSRSRVVSRTAPLVGNRSNYDSSFAARFPIVPRSRSTRQRGLIRSSRNAIERESLDATTSEMTLRIEPTRLPRDFQFRVRAGDGDTGWLAVQVLPPTGAGSARRPTITATADSTSLPTPT